MTPVPDASLPWLAVAAVLGLVVAGYLAAAEAALSRLTRAEAQRLAADGRRGAPAVLALVADPVPALSVATLVRVTFEALATVCAALASAALFSQWWAGLVTGVVMGGVVFTLLGVSPRTVGRQDPEGMALRSAGQLRALTTALGPVARGLVAVANAVTPGRGYRDGPFSTEGELRELVDRASESAIIEAGEREMIHSVFELGDTIVREVMSPRTDMVTIAEDAGPREALDLFLASGHSRLPVIGSTVDDVLGVLHLKDVVRVLHDRPVRRRGATDRARDLARRPVFVPETKQVDALLREMQSASLHLALVIDEYGGVAGLVTLEDLLEEIVGEITDETDTEEPDVVPLEDGGFRVSARLHVEDLGDLFGLEVEEDEVDSTGGLLAKALGTVPAVGDEAEVAGLHLLADEVDGHRIVTVVVHRAPEPEPDEDDDDRERAEREKAERKREKRERKERERKQQEEERERQTLHDQTLPEERIRATEQQQEQELVHGDH
ncbi:Hemolysin, contains CBS domains [Quadrisphaera granulorum]|uniref:CBS domain containing-hemolysin-like protein n=1 Tax=Quadrisphaera granulorum TaxID=317664 RepID=A0A316AVB7_9ACTN|nr:hemolysin family protein [Quadrisphaera granulorum]PWJ54037.1 CBS domain containing-hemolysin-like protein [Quadrisphaera granulorum]SZE96494.1 Hemolysin, contains CBS domains [Quadrisphaera granulorum]